MAGYDTVAIVGVGLIGGSIGRALRERNLARQVVGIGRRESSLEAARRVGAFDRGTIDLAEGAKDAELVVVATPVGTIVDTVLAVAQASSRAIITDAGSTKAEICRLVRSAAISRDRPVPLSGRFVGSHPLAGDHRTGPQFARADLLDRRTVVVTPEDDTPPNLVEYVEAFWRSLGAKVVLMPPEEHDRALAATSHLPHLVAAALAAATPQRWLPLAATGWADTTRIAASDPLLWSQIFAQNRESVLDALGQFEQRLEGLKNALNRDDAADLITRLQEAKGIRDALGD
jgi:prephenate dehydrogenase